MQSKKDEAERRIEEARRLQSESLDLGDLELEDLPASLRTLTHLRKLYLGDVGPSDSGELKWYEERQPARFADLSALAGLYGLQELNLSSTGVTDLSALAGLSGLQSLNLSSTGVTDLSALAGLSGLQDLVLAWCKGVTDLSALAGLSGIQSLDLTGTEMTDLSALAGLSGLQSLNLSNTGVTDLSSLAGLSGLQELDLSRTGVTDLSALAGLSGLQELDLSSTGVTDLSALAGLSGLQDLDLSSTGVTDLSALAGLSGLQVLILSSTGVTDLSALAGLSGLQVLILSSTGVTDLSALAGLSGLQFLILSSTAVTDLSALVGLSELQYLSLSSTGVTDLPALAGLSGLQYLSLSSTGVTDLSALTGLSGIQELDLSYTQVTDLSTLAEFSRLQNLDLSWCTGLTDLSALTGLSRLESLDVYGCQLEAPVLKYLLDQPRLAKLMASEIASVPREVLSRSPANDCLPRLRAWWAELRQGAETENEVKIILLGNGRVGKTQLCRRFRGLDFDGSVESTHGVQIWRQELRVKTEGHEEIFQANWWDFGGQDIYHGTHALFLRSRAVFLLLWTPERENREEKDEDGIAVRNQPLAYWLNYVRSLAGADSPVIVVQSHCDGHVDRRSDPLRPEGFAFFETCAYSALNNRGRETLESHLREAIRYVREQSGALEIGVGRAEVRRRLYAMRSADQERQPEERQNRTLTRAEFQALCEEVGGIVSWKHALDYFHQTGVVFYREDLFSDCILLDQDWALEAVYAVFHRGRTVPCLRDRGRFTREDLAALVWQDHSPEEQRLFLGLMESCGVCFPCGETVKGEQRYLAPDLLPGFDAVHLPAWDDEAETAALELIYSFFHPAVIRGFMSEIGWKAGEKAEYWKYGLWFKDGQRGAQVRVRFVDTSSDAAPGAGILRLEAQGREPLKLLGEVRKAILRQRVGEAPEERLIVGGATVTRKALDNLLDGHVLTEDKKLVRADGFAAFFEGRENETVIEIDPQPVRAADKRAPEVFISYGWGDDSPEGKVRAQVVDALQARLERDGFQPVRDRDQMKNGDRISAFMRQLTRADLLVAVISDKYLRSSYCMYEIYRLWQRAQADADELLRVLVPVLLPEVRIDHFEDRAPYLEYWGERADRLEALVRNPKLRPSKESWEEVRLVREFSHHVDDILVFLHDVLMPRQLDVHLDAGLDAVCEALRRRLAERAA